MKWEKLGIIFKPNKHFLPHRTHAAIPTPIQLNKNTIRIFLIPDVLKGFLCLIL